MKQDLLAVVEQGTEIYNAIDGNEVVNFAKLNAITLKIVTNQVGEIVFSTLVDGSITGDERLTSDLEERELPMNEIFNDYNNNIVGAPSGGGVTGGSGNHVEGITNNVWSDFTSQADHIEGQDNLFLSNVRFMFGKNVNSSVEAINQGVTDWQVVKTNGVHIEGYQNYSLYSDTNHIEGSKNVSIGSDYSHNEGYGNLAFGKYSHIEGYSDNTIINELAITKNYATDLLSIQPKIKNVIDNASDLNNPTYDTILNPDPYTLVGNKETNLKSAIANEYLSYKYNYDVEPTFVISPYSKGSAFGEASHTEGNNNTSFGKTSHSEGKYTSANADYTHSEGLYSHAFNKGAHVEGGYNVAGSFVILSPDGKDITRSSSNVYSQTLSHQITKLTNFDNNSDTRLIFDEASFDSSKSPTHNTDYTIKTGFQVTDSSASNYINTTYTDQSLAGISFVDIITREDGIKGYQHAEGYNNLAFGDLTHTEGFRNWAITPGVHIEGVDNLATYTTPLTSNRQLDYLGMHIEGSSNVAYGGGSVHVEGAENLVQGSNTSNPGVHIEGFQNIVKSYGPGVHVEGYFNVGGSLASHTEGSYFTLRDYATVSDNNVTYNYENQYMNGNYTYVNELYSWGPKTAWSSTKITGVITLPDGSTRTNYSYSFPNYNMGANSHVEGTGIMFTGGESCHFEGSVYKCLSNTTTSGNNTYNYYTTFFDNVSGSALHVEGRGHTGGGTNCHIEGDRNNIGGTGIHIEGYNNNSYAEYSHTEGIKNQTSMAPGCHAEGYGTKAYAYAAHAEGSAINTLDTDNSNKIIADIVSQNSATGGIIVQSTTVLDPGTSVTQKTLRQLINEKSDSASKDSYSNYYDAPSSRSYVQASGVGSHAEGGATTAYAHASHTEGLYCTTLSYSYDTYNSIAAHAEGICTYTYGPAAHSEGIGTVSWAQASHSEGIGYGNSFMPSSNGIGSHTEGYHTQTSSSSYAGHAEGYETCTKAQAAHSEGQRTIAEGNASHAGGYYSNALNDYSFVHGTYLNTDYNNQFVIGKYNKLKASGDTTTPDNLFIIGNGTADNNRNNALTVDINGKLTINDVSFGTISSLNDEIARMWEAINQGGGGGGSTTLAGLTDVDISNPTNGQVLIYNSNLGKWVNGTITPSGDTPSQSNVMVSILSGSSVDIETGIMQESE